MVIIMDGNRLDPIKPRKLSEEVKKRLITMIESGEVHSGKKMPSESELMRRFQVGRPAVREAMQALENMGLLSIRHGERATLRSPSAQEIIKQVDLVTRHLLMSSQENIEHLKEARQLFEVGVVKIACNRATDEEIDQLEMQLQKMKDNQSNSHKFRQADQEFHIMIADISKNPIFAAIARAMLGWLKDYRQAMLGVPGLESLILKEHKLIFDCIKAGDAEAAARALSDHILRVNARYRKK